MSTPIDAYRLNNGHNIPKIGLGTVGLKGNRGKLAIIDAIQKGYRFIDTSTNYNNEGIVGKAVKASGIPRSELFIGTKLPGEFHKYDSALEIIQEQLARLDLDYFDQYLIHWPNPDDGLYPEAWKALIQAQKLGYIRSIGVSNFLEEHLDKIIEETGVIPAVNQIEVHPYFTNEEARKPNQERNILTQSWSPLGRNLNDLRENETIKEIGEVYGKSNAQVIIRWNLQLGHLPIVKSGDPIHQEENLNVFDFELTDDEMAIISGLHKGEEGRVEGQHPNEYHEYE